MGSRVKPGLDGGGELRQRSRERALQSSRDGLGDSAATLGKRKGVELGHSREVRMDKTVTYEMALSLPLGK